MEAYPVNSPEWLEFLLRDRCGFTSVRKFQLDHGLDIIHGRDVFLVVAPGQGKTTVIHAPLIAAQAKLEAGIALCIVPTKVLGVQQARIAEERGIRALAINEDTVREAYYQEPRRDLLSELEAGEDVRMGIMSAQMLKSERMKNFIAKGTTRKLIRWFVVDEAHLLDEEGASWIEVYKHICTMRARLPSHTVWLAMTGTANPEKALKVTSKLGFQPGHHISARYSIDAPHIKYITRFFEYPTSGDEFFDISFLIPFSMTSPQQIPVTLIFCDTIDCGYRLMRFLDRLIPSSVPNHLKIIKLYNALMPDDYRSQFVKDLTEGTTLRIGICTDTCTYGFDVSTIERVCVVGLCKTVECLKQRICRLRQHGAAVRIVYTYAPSWVRNIPPAEIERPQAKIDLGRRTKLHPAMLEWYNPTPERCPRQADLAYYGEPFVPRDPCCSFHHPNPERDDDAALIKKWIAHLADHTPTAKGPSLRTDGTYYPLEPHMKASASRMLERWRYLKWTDIQPNNTGFPSHIFLSTATVSRLADKAHICTTLERLSAVIGPWEYFEQFGVDLLDFLTVMMRGFQSIIEEREAAAASGSAVQEEKSESVKQVTIKRVKLTVTSPNTLSNKRAATPTIDDTHKIVIKRTRSSHKENVHVDDT